MQKSFKNYLVFSLSILFLLYEFVIRVSPSVMVADLMRAFDVDATHLGSLSAFFFFAYSPMQFPVGFLMDRYGARRLLTFAAFVCGLGALFFGLTTSLSIAEGSRFLMGIGSAFAFVGMVYICSHRFPHEKLALMVGIGNSIGILGAVIGEGPLSQLALAIGWRPTMLLLGIIGILLAIVIFSIVRTDPPPPSPNQHQRHNTLKEVLSGMLRVAASGQTWINAVASLLFYVVLGGFASLWAVPFLKQATGMPQSVAATASSMMFVGNIVGGPVIGHWADTMSRRKTALILSAFVCLCALTPVIYFPHLSHTLTFILLFITGFAIGGQLLSFSYAIELNAIESKGTSIALTNFVISLGSAIFQPLVGYLLDTFSHRVTPYTLHEYQMALTVFPVALICSICLLFRLKKPKQAS